MGVHLTDLKISILKDIYLENRFIYNKLEAILFKQLQAAWSNTPSLLWIFNVYEFCCFNFLPKNVNCFPSVNEDLSFINYRLIWEKILKCKGEQIDFKTELKLPNNLFYLY
jgi:hypothetical protein